MSTEAEKRLEKLELYIKQLEEKISVMEISKAKRNEVVAPSVVTVSVSKPVQSVDSIAAVEVVAAVEEKKQDKPKKEKPVKGDKPRVAPNSKKAAPAENVGVITVDVDALKYNHDSFHPEPVVDAETNYQNSNTNTDSDIAVAYNDNEKRFRGLCKDLPSSLIFRAPSAYYSWKLEQRRALLNAPSTHYLCKSMVMHNSKCTHDDYTNKADSKYYLVVIQYTARLHNERLGYAIRTLSNPMPGRNKFNFRWVDTDTNDKLTGYSHNGVTPLGTATKIPVVISDRIVNLEEGFFWLGAGEVDLKWRVSVKDFLKYFDPIIANITYDGTIDETEEN